MKISPVVKTPWSDAGLLLLLLAVVYLALFWQLGTSPVIMWDEGRLAVNAAEMARSGNWLVTTYGGQPDMWNTKPPLLIWLQALLFRTLGYQELALRLPSALAGLGTAALLGWFAFRYLGGRLAAVLSILILLGTDGYIEYHVTRNGDYDALLIFFQTGYLLSYFRYLEEERRAQLGWFALLLTLALLTKGVAGAMPLPALLFYTLLRRRLGWVLRQPGLYLAIVAVVGTVGGYYGLREAANPGYLQSVYDNELGGRLLTTIENHLEPWNWYWQAIIGRKFLPWLFVLPLAVLLTQRAPAPAVRHFGWLALCFLLSFFGIISAAQTKLLWYEAPLYPLAALLAAYGVAELLRALLAYFHFSPQATPWVLALVFFCLFWRPATVIFDKLQLVRALRYNDPELQFGYHLRQQQQAHPEITTYTLLSRGDYNASMIFYALAATQQYGHQATPGFGSQLAGCVPGQRVVVCDPGLLGQVQARFQTDLLYQSPQGSTLLLKARNP